MTSENMEQLSHLATFIAKSLNIRRKWLTRVIEFLINLHLNLFVLYKCYDSSINVYSSLLFIIMYSSLFLCYLLNFIDDITQYGACYAVAIKLLEFEFAFISIHKTWWIDKATGTRVTWWRVTHGWWIPYTLWVINTRNDFQVRGVSSTWLNNNTLMKPQQLLKCSRSKYIYIYTHTSYVVHYAHTVKFEPLKSYICL